MMDKDINISPATFMAQMLPGHGCDQDGIPAGFSLLPDGIYHEAAPNEPQRVC